MTMTIEKKLQDFIFWGGARSNAMKLTCEELDNIESQIEEINEANGDTPMSATEVNDFFWHDFETICEWLGLDYEEVMARK